jgi:hypothetical protein
MRVFAWFTLLGLLVPGGASAQITVGPNVQVSLANGDRRHFEVLAAADPVHPDRLLACSMVLSTKANAKSVIVYASFDGGASWKPTLEDTRSSFVGDPACVYGFADTAYAATLPIMKGPHGEAEMAIYRSIDGGRTWQAPTVRPFIDREYLAVDRSTGPHRGRVYLYANGERLDSAGTRVSAQLQLLRSLDGGKTFGEPVGAPTSERYQVMIPGTGAVMPDGRIAIPFMALESMHDTTGLIGVTIADQGGERLTTPVVIGGSSQCRRPGVGLGVAAAVDESDGPFRGRLYVVWSGGRSGRCEIMLATSSDTGRTWSTPVHVNDDVTRPDPRNGPDDFMPAVAVNNAGVVGVSWYDRRDRPDNRGFDLRFAASMDGGMSFLPSVPVSPKSDGRPAPASRELIAFVDGGGCRCRHMRGGPLVSHVNSDEVVYGVGDTRDMVADSRGVFHPFWYDSRTGVSQLWTAPVTVSGRAALHGSPALAALQDVTDQVTLDYANTSYDPRTGSVSLDAMITNTSDSVLQGPMKVRVLRLSSPAGVPRLIDAANGERGAGAVLDFSPMLPDGRLRPGESSRAMRLRFAITDFRPDWSNPPAGRLWLRPALLTLTTRVLAGPRVVP